MIYYMRKPGGSLKLIKTVIYDVFLGKLFINLNLRKKNTFKGTLLVKGGEASSFCLFTMSEFGFETKEVYFY